MCVRNTGHSRIFLMCIAEILLKVALNTINQIKSNQFGLRYIRVACCRRKRSDIDIRW